MARDAAEAPPRLPVAPLFRPAAGDRSPGAPACTPVPSLSCRGLGPPRREGPSKACAAPFCGL